MYLATAQHTPPPETVSALAHYSAPLYIAIPIIAAVVILKVGVAKWQGRPALGGEIEVRCSKGHTFQTNWSPFGSFKAIRLGPARYQRCPVGAHWSLVRPVQ